MTLLVTVLAVAAALAGSLHAVLYKRDPRSAIGWIGFMWLAPLVGPFAYLILGINRIRRKASRMRPARSRLERPLYAADCQVEVPPSEQHLANLVRLGDRVCGNHLLRGNHVEVLEGGPLAFPVILAALESAERSILLSTYIFENDATGRRVVDALGAAARRGVEVRVLIDPVGALTSLGDISAELRASGAHVNPFHAPGFPIRVMAVNLRNHRKLIVIDGAIAFTGGMNIGDDYSNEPGAAFPMTDVHFKLHGPVLVDLHRAFVVDWLFTTGERLPDLPSAFSADAAVAVRVVSDGPDEEFERSRWMLLGAIASARRSIRIATPYFLPDMAIITALNVAVMRGVPVEICIPAKLDHAVVGWAMDATLWQVLEKGCRVWRTPPPFDHSKLFAIDGVWAFVGSSNWDARSLRLNFELNVEILGATTAGQIDALIEQRKSRGREISLAEVDSRPLPRRIRDGLARLLSPYL